MATPIVWTMQRRYRAGMDPLLIPFGAPVTILVSEAGVVAPRAIVDAVAARDAMLSWPNRGDRWVEAFDILTELIYGRGSPDIARTAFADAAVEAGVLVEPSI